MVLEHIDTILVLTLITVFSYFLPPLLDGVERKIKARVHSRIGPSLLQTWYDLFKLFGKSIHLPKGTYYIVLLIVLYLVLIVSAIGVLLSITLINMYIAFITAIILFMTGQAVFVVISFMSSNPFAIVGGSREIMLMLVNELFTVLTFGVILWYTNGFLDIGPAYYIAIAVLLVAAYVSCARPPFDLAEAEPELASGVIIELSGPLLGLLQYSNLARRFFIKLFIVMLGVTPFTINYSGSNSYMSLNGLLLSVVMVVILWCIFATISALLGRSRIDVAPVSLLKIYIPLLILFLALAFITR